jgi:hypothetical protein
MATLASQKITRAGIAPALVAAAVGGDRFTPDGETFLHVKNGGSSAITVTIVATEKINGDLALANVTKSVAAGVEALLGPFPKQAFQAADGSGLADVTYSGVTSVTVGAFKLTQP